MTLTVAPHPLRVGFDLDGVVYDFDRAVARYFHHALDIPMQDMPRPDRWNTWECWGMSKAFWVKHVHQGVDEGYIFGFGAPERGAVDLFAALRQIGHTVHIVTARESMGSPGRALVNTRIWLHQNDLHSDTFTMSADKTSVPLDVMIDDNLDNYDALDAAGVRVFLRDRPWNHDDGQRRRVGDLFDYYNEIWALSHERAAEATAVEVAVLPGSNDSPTPNLAPV